MRNATIEGLQPGFYLVDGWRQFFIEKTEDGTVHQLIPETGERDGILELEGWNRSTVVCRQVYAPRRHHHATF